MHRCAFLCAPVCVSLHRQDSGKGTKTDNNGGKMMLKGFDRYIFKQHLWPEHSRLTPFSLRPHLLIRTRRMSRVLHDQLGHDQRFRRHSGRRRSPRVRRVPVSGATRPDLFQSSMGLELQHRRSQRRMPRTVTGHVTGRLRVGRERSHWSGPVGRYGLMG